MAYHNEDIAACMNDRCPKRLTCLRWQLGTNKDPYQTYLDGNSCDEEFYIEHNQWMENPSAFSGGGENRVITN